MTNQAKQLRTVRMGMMRNVMMGLALGAVLGTSSGCMDLMAMVHGRVERPTAEEFGFGPRTSEGGGYVATLESAAPLRTRRMQSVRLTVRTADRLPVDGATITVDGGMPEHGHGLPTRPRVTRQVAPGTYEVEGLKFNMGGWWEVKFRFDSASGTDSVTFNLDL
jgi:hypothetical protein